MLPVLASLATNFNATSDGADGPVRFLTHFNSVSPGFFETLGIPLRAGRGFTAADRTGATSVAVVNERAAALLGGDQHSRRAADPGDRQRRDHRRRRRRKR